MTHILLVEDDQAITQNLMILLQTEGFSVTQAASKNQASKFLVENKFDLALVDISLPDGNGFTVYTEIKAEQDIPVIFLTASGDESSVVTGLNMGAEDYVTKPFRPRELLARMKVALRKSGQIQATFEINGLFVDSTSGLVKKTAMKSFCLLWNIACCLFLSIIPTLF